MQRLRQERLAKLRASKRDDRRCQQLIGESRVASHEALRAELRRETRTRREEEARAGQWKEGWHEEHLQQLKTALRVETLERQRQEQQVEAIRSAGKAETKQLRQGRDLQVPREGFALPERLRERRELEQREARAARLRGQQRLSGQSETAQKQHEKELRTERFRQRREQEQLEAWATRLREQQQLAGQSEAARAHREEELRKAHLHEHRELELQEGRAALLRDQKRLSVQSKTAQEQREEEVRTARLRALREQEQREALVVQHREQQQVRQQQALQRRQEGKRRATRIEQLGRRQAGTAMPAPVSRRPLQRLNKRRAERLMGFRALQRQAVSSAVLADNVAPELLLDELPWLSTRGSFIVDELWNPVYLRGVTFRGLDEVNPQGTQPFPSALSIDERNLSVLTDLWGANLVRIPFQAQTLLSGNGFLSADKILQGLDECVATVTQMGAYVLLALEPSSGNGSPATPDADLFRIWRLLANHYQDEPGVLYEIFASLVPLANNWLETALMLIGTIRLENPASLIFLGSGKGGANVNGLPLRFSTADPVFNIVYTMGVSPQHLPAPEDPQLRALASSYPICVSMWLDGGTDYGRSSQMVANLFESYGMGWVASSWNTEPRLVTNATTHDLSSTRWGLIVQRALVQPVKPLLPPLV